MKNIFSELNAIQAEVDKIFLPFHNALKEVTAFDREIKRVLREINPVDISNDANRQNDNLYCYPCIEPPRNDLVDKLEYIADFLIDQIQQERAEKDEEDTTCATVH